MSSAHLLYSCHKHYVIVYTLLVLFPGPGNFGKWTMCVHDNHGADESNCIATDSETQAEVIQTKA